MVLASKKKSNFQKTYVQLNLITDDEGDAKAIQRIIEGIENIIYVLSIFSLIILYFFEFIHKVFLTLNELITTAWEFGTFRVKIEVIILKLLGSEATSWLKQGYSV